MDNFSIVWALNMIDNKCSNEQSVYYLFKKKGSVVKAIYFFTYKKHVNFFEILSIS